jgi:hypothetical protein
MSQPVNSNGNVTTPAPAPQIPTQAQPGPVSAPPSPQYPPQRLAAAQPQPTQPQYYSPYATQQYPVYGQPLGSPSGFVMPADGQQFLGLLQTRDTAGLNGLALQVAAGGQFAIAQQATTQALNVLNHAQALGAQAQIPGGVMPFVAQAPAQAAQATTQAQAAQATTPAQAQHSAQVQQKNRLGLGLGLLIGSIMGLIALIVLNVNGKSWHLTGWSNSGLFHFVLAAIIGTAIGFCVSALWDRIVRTRIYNVSVQVSPNGQVQNGPAPTNP